MNNQIKVDDLYKIVKSNLKSKYNNIYNNYKELYKNYGDAELIRDNNLNEIKRDLKNLKKQLENKEDNIYIYFQYLSSVNYDHSKIKDIVFNITEENYFYFLDCLPPLKMDDKGFYVSEFLTGDYTNYYFKKGNSFYVTVKDAGFIRGSLKGMI